MNSEILHELKERVKELTALHRTARILQDETKPVDEVIREVTDLLPPAWQYPEITCARVRFQQWEVSTPGFQKTQWIQRASFATRGGQNGSIEICYLQARPTADEGPFLKEERELIDSLAEMLRSYFQHWLADQELHSAHRDLERLVDGRTEELRQANAALQTQIADYQRAQQEIEGHHRQLRQLAAELSLAEARERRAIAADLHDHIGQALAFIKMNISQFSGNAIFCGFEEKIEEITSLLDQTIRYTRDLTFEISPPVLYELGLDAALEWLADRFQRKHGLNVAVKRTTDVAKLSDDIQITLFKSVQELLTNAVKHGRADTVTISLGGGDGRTEIEVMDNGCGFEPGILATTASQDEHFGLFNIRERLSYLGGNLVIQSLPGKGTAITLQVPRPVR
jgi:signal transduction histidine kinase